jgi:hypothetical protein
MKKKLLLFISFLFLLSPIVKGYEGIGVIGGRSAAMGKTSVCLTDFWSIQNNPAGMALQDRFGFGIAYENRFLMKELSLKSAAFVAPLNFGVLGVSFNQFGYDLYNENKFGLAYARNFGNLLRIGLQLDYLNIGMPNGYDNINKVSFELGVQSSVSEKITLGAYIFNPINVKASKLTEERLPIIMRIGASMAFTKEFMGTCEVEKVTNDDPSLRFGLEYLLLKRFFIRTGVATDTGLFTFGLGFDIGPVMLDVSGQIHQVLGSSIQSSLIYQFGKK